MSLFRAACSVVSVATIVASTGCKNDLASDPSSPDNPTPGDANIIIVRASAVTVQELEGSARRTRFQIEHAYSGRRGLVGRTFAIETTAPLMFSGGLDFVSPPFEVGEDVIWVVSDQGGRLVPRFAPRLSPRSVCGLPRYSRKSRLGEQDTTNRSFAVVAAWAESVEAFHRSKAKEDLLSKLVASENRYIGPWAIYELAELKTRAAFSVLDQLEPEILSIPAQVALDEVRCELENCDWSNSDRRSRLMKRWLGSSDFTTRHYLPFQRLIQAFENGQYTRKEYLDWVKYCVKNGFADVDRMAKLLEPLGQEQKLNDPELEKRVLDYLIGIVKVGGPEGVYAARLLARYQNIAPSIAQIEAIRATRSKSTNESMNEELDVVLRRNPILS